MSEQLISHQILLSVCRELEGTVISLTQDRRGVQQAWEAFVRGGEVAGHPVNGVIRESWMRSRQLGVNPWQLVGPERVSPEELHQLREVKQTLLDAASPLMDHLYEWVKGTGFVVTLCDERGFLFHVLGDPDTLQKAQEIEFVAGANWSERAVGTNAIGTCLVLNQPLQVSAAEHFSVACQGWTCSAAPIHGPDGDVIGVLNLSGTWEKVHPHTLGLVVSAARVIENHLMLQERSRRAERMGGYLEAAVNALNEAVLVLSQDRRIIKVNKIFQEFFGLHEEQVVGQLVTDVWENPLWTVCLAGCSNREVSFPVRETGHSVHGLLNVYPIQNGAGQPLGSLVTLREIQEVRQFINHMTNSRAKIEFSDIIGENSAFLEALGDAKLAAHTDTTVLLQGESGTGKELFAQAIHSASHRRHKPFIALNCGAIPRDLLGSELFGYAEGAFTGARRGGSAGKFELAEGGTLFLDEVGEMSLEMQVLLLRVLQNREVTRLGGDRVIPVNVRILAATNKDLKVEVHKGNFRDDLYYRLNVMLIRIPPLRERIDDIARLTQAFTGQFAVRLQRPRLQVAPSLLNRLEQWPWPGNVRELQNVLERMAIRTQGEWLTPDLLPQELQELSSIPDASWRTHRNFLQETLFQTGGMTEEGVQGPHFSNSEFPRASLAGMDLPGGISGLPLKDQLQRAALLDSLRASRGNHKEAARILGVARSTLYRQIKKFGLS